MVDGQKKRPHGRRTKKGRPRNPPGHVRPSKRRSRKRCGATAKSSGKPCRRWAMANGRCVIHGGKSPKGEDHPSFKTGLHSKYYTHKLEDFLEANPAVAEDLDQADLQGVDDEIRLFTAMLMMHMEKKPKRGKGRSDWIVGTVDILAELIKAKERRHKMQKELRTITLEELQNLIRRYTILVYTAVENEVQDQTVREKLLARLQTIPDQVAVSVGT